MVGTTVWGWRMFPSHLYISIAVTFFLGGRRKSQPSNSSLFNGMARMAMATFSLRELDCMEEGLNKSSKSLKQKAEQKTHVAIFHQHFLMCKYNSSPLLLAGAEVQLMKQPWSPTTENFSEKIQWEICAAACWPCSQLMPGNWFLTLPGTLEKLQGNWYAMGKREISQKLLHVSAPEHALPHKIESKLVLHALVPGLMWNGSSGTNRGIYIQNENIWQHNRNSITAEKSGEIWRGTKETVWREWKQGEEGRTRWPLEEWPVF